jgi:quercetin dioxygenase-like cupin family protein
MRVTNLSQIDRQPVQMEGSHGCHVRWLVGERDEAPNFAMRQFEVAPGGYTPHHSHPYEHEVFVLEGEGVILDGTGDRPVERRLRAGDVVYVAPNDVHQFRNPGNVPLKFLCLVPNSAYGLPATMCAPECGVERK